MNSLKKKYEFLDCIKDKKSLVDVLKKLFEKKKIKINLILENILINISVLYTTIYGHIEEMKFTLRHSDVEKKEMLDMALSEMILMKENKNNPKRIEDEEKDSNKIKKKEKNIRILMLRLDSGGKISILYQLKTGKKVKTIPTVGFNLEEIVFNGPKLSICDVSGDEKIEAIMEIILSFH